MENEQIVATEATAIAETEVKENREPREQRERAPFRNKRRK